jgi:hypothetical protein
VAKQDVLYAKAETQNVRRRLEKDIADARLCRHQLCPRHPSVADNLARALESIPPICARMTSSEPGDRPGSHGREIERFSATTASPASPPRACRSTRISIRP